MRALTCNGDHTREGCADRPCNILVDGPLRFSSSVLRFLRVLFTSLSNPPTPTAKQIVFEVEKETPVIRTQF